MMETFCDRLHQPTIREVTLTGTPIIGGEPIGVGLVLDPVFRPSLREIVLVPGSAVCSEQMPGRVSWQTRRWGLAHRLLSSLRHILCSLRRLAIRAPKAPSYLSENPSLPPVGLADDRMTDAGGEHNAPGKGGAA